MKGYIAICQHFHQPHFQLHNIRERVFYSSYLKWINLLDSISTIRGVYINMHFSGPFLYWIKNEKQEYLLHLAKLVKKGNIGIIGGFADEAFIQLSTREDDALFQIKTYENLVEQLFNIRACDWQGFHIPERECGEFLLKSTTKALSMIGASPIYYLDAETFYPCHYAEPGGVADYCTRLFGFEDPVSRTTISHYPLSMLHFAMRDVISGNAFFTLPIHCEERYWFLRSDLSFGGIHPRDYLDSIKQRLWRASEQSEAFGKKITPIAIIFEDAEKLGDWSDNPDRDVAWLYELVKIICEDDDVTLIGLKDYCSEQGGFDTYPISSSHSYIEWENWTAKRGIRGVVYSDEKIRKTVTLLHQIEHRIECFERIVLKKYMDIHHDRVIEAVMDASDRYMCISEILKEKFEEPVSDYYFLLQRVRNLLYQEDSKWATRHPNYGSAPYLDNVGISFFEVAWRLLLYLESFLETECVKKDEVFSDWMEDGIKRVVIRTEHQTISLNPNGAAVDYHVVLNCSYSNHALFTIVLPDIKEMKTYPSIFRYVSPVVFTETDSRLCHVFDPKGERIEKCRKSFTVFLSRWNGTDYEQIAEFRDAHFSLRTYEKINGGYRVGFQTDYSVEMKDLNITVKLIKTFIIMGNDITVMTVAETEDIGYLDLFLSIEVVTSLTASDEVNCLPSEGITIPPGLERCNYVIKSSDGNKRTIECPSNGKVIFTYCIQTGAQDAFRNGIEYSFMGAPALSHIIISPTVSNFYNNYVGQEQGGLGYTSSGVMMVPYTEIKAGKAAITVKQKFLWDVEEPLKETYYSLVES